MGQPARVGRTIARAVKLCDSLAATFSNNAVIRNAWFSTTYQTYQVYTENRLVFINLHFVKVRTSHTAEPLGNIAVLKIEKLDNISPLLRFSSCEHGYSLSSEHARPACVGMNCA